MFIAWVIFHVIVCLALILVVLLQSSKGEGLSGSAFGGGGGGMGGAVFGGRGAASFLSTATSVLAGLFMINCIALAIMSAGSRQAVAGGGTTATESAVTRQAQAERERSLQQQQQQLLNDSLNVSSSISADSTLNIRLTPPDSN